MEALNGQTPLDEFQLDNFQGGLECNIEEVSMQILYPYFECNRFGAIFVKSFFFPFLVWYYDILH